MWDYATQGQQPAAAGSWYDPSKIEAAVKAQGPGGDGRTILQGQNLLSIMNPLSGLKVREAGGMVGYTPFLNMGDQPEGTAPPETTYSYSPGSYQTADGSVFNIGLPDDGNWTDEATFKAAQARAAAAAGLDPNGTYVYNATARNNPTGNGSRDQATGYYQISEDGTAKPVAALNQYSPGDWSDFYRPLLKNGALVIGSALGAAGLASAAGVGAGAGAAAAPAAAEGGAIGAGAASADGALAGGVLGGGQVTSIGSGLGLEGFGSGLGAATTSAGVTGGLTEAGALGAVGGSLSASGLTTAGLAGATGSGLSSGMQSAIKAATSPAGSKLIGAGLSAALAGGAAAGVAGAGGSSGTTGAASDVATAQQALAQQQLAFNQKAYEAGQPTRDAATAGALQAQTGQLATQQQQNAIAQRYNTEDVSTFAPLRQQIVDDAKNYDTAGRRADAMAGATSDVEQAYASANDANNRAMLRAGVTPGSGRMQSLMADQAIAKANSLAGATTTAVRNVENTGASRMAAAAQLGSFLPGAQTSAASAGSAAGTAAANSGANAVATQGSGITNVNAGFSGATAANNSAGNLYQQATAQKNATDAAYNATLGQLGGAVGNYLGTTQGQQNLSDLANWISDEKVKKNTGKRANPMKALAEINATRVEDGWQYDPQKGGPEDGGRKHIGPMAQTVRRTMGETVAPGGKSISPVDMNGKLLAGMQALSAKVAKLEKNQKARAA